MTPECPETQRFLSRVSAAASASPLYADPPRSRAPFRLVLVGPESIPGWLWTFLGIAADAGWLQVSVLPVAGARLATVAGVPMGARLFLAQERLYRRRPSAPLSRVAVSASDGIGVGVPIALAAGTRALRARLDELRPDLVLSLAPREWSALLAEPATYGCWDIDAGLVDAEHGGMALMLPMARGETATELALELDGAAPPPWSRISSVGATRLGSFAQQRDYAFLKLPLLLLRMVHRLAMDEAAPRRLQASLRMAAPAMPDVGDAARTLRTTLATTLRWQMHKGKRSADTWLLVFRQSPARLDPQVPNVDHQIVLQAPRGSFWADPCAVEAGGRRFVFVEEFDERAKGMIVCLELHGGKASRLGLVLEEPGHLSYPQVFESDGEWYMTVESGQLKRVSLYRATRFPLGWERIDDLVRDRICADPTLYFHDGHWYLFATVSENRNGTWDELFLFVSDQLRGPFEPHPANPIVSDVRRARPAGRLFVHEGKLIRPSQDCASHYGSAVVFNEVLVLSPTQYEERPLSRLTPDWEAALTACHTYSASETMEVLDARGSVPEATARLELVPASESMLSDEVDPEALPPMTGRPPVADRGRPFGRAPGPD